VNGLKLLADNALGLKGEYEIGELCELIHSEGAETIGVYRDDFYAGQPALTVNRLGRGNAYHLAGRVKEDSFYDAFYAGLVKEAGIRKAIETMLPPGVTAQVRTDGENDYVFVMNFSGKEQSVTLDGRDYTDMETGQTLETVLSLPVSGVRILKR
jgi:beta-galactosidase